MKSRENYGDVELDTLTPNPSPLKGEGSVLQQCPFCGSPMTVDVDDEVFGKGSHHPTADCWLSNNLIYHDDLVRLWNKRPGEDRLKDENEALTKALFAAFGLHKRTMELIMQWDKDMAQNLAVILVMDGLGKIKTTENTKDTEKKNEID